MATNRELKAQLRNQVKENVAALSSLNISSQSAAAQRTILSLPQWQTAQRVGIYLSMPSGEIQTDILIRDALRTGKAIFVPYLHTAPTISDAGNQMSQKRRRMDMLRLESSAEFDGLGRDSWGIPTLASVERKENAMGGNGPEASCDKAESLDIIIMPGVAFDLQMNRLGHGAGFYDKFLARFCTDGKGRLKPFLVGLCLAEQVLPPDQELATEAWDWKVDAVAAGDGTLMKPWR